MFSTCSRDNDAALVCGSSCTFVLMNPPKYFHSISLADSLRVVAADGGNPPSDGATLFFAVTPHSEQRFTPHSALTYTPELRAKIAARTERHESMDRCTTLELGFNRERAVQDLQPLIHAD
jgi:hypothetical protein